MKIEINIEKKHVYILSALILLFGAFFVYAQTEFSINFDPAKGWRPIWQITSDGAGTTSVDEDANGQIDHADEADTAVEILTFGGYTFQELFPSLVGVDCKVVESINGSMKNTWIPVDVPDGSDGNPDCIDSFCIIKLRKEDDKGIKTIQRRYKERLSDGKWTQPDGSTFKYTNGDTSETNILSLGGDNDRIILRDDENAKGGDNRARSKWAVYWDDNKAISMQVIVCNEE